MLTKITSLSRRYQHTLAKNVVNDYIFSSVLLSMRVEIKNFKK